MMHSSVAVSQTWKVHVASYMQRLISASQWYTQKMGGVCVLKHTRGVTVDNYCSCVGIALPHGIYHTV